MGQCGGYDYRPMSVLQVYYNKVSNGNVRYDSHYDAEGLVIWKCNCGTVYYQGQYINPITNIDDKLEAWCKEHSHGAKVLPINYKEIRENVKNLIQEQVGPEYSVKLSENEIEYIASQDGVYKEIAIKQVVLGQLVMFNADEPKRNALQVDIKNLTASLKDALDAILMPGGPYSIPIEVIKQQSNYNNVLDSILDALGGNNLGQGISKGAKTATGEQLLIEQTAKQYSNKLLLQQIEEQKELIANIKKKKSFINGVAIEKQLVEQQAELKKLQQKWYEKIKQLQEMNPILPVNPKPASSSIVKPAPIIEPEAPKIPVLETNGRRIFRDE